MIRTIDVREISKNIKEMCIEANHYLSKDMDTAMKQAEQDEKSPLGKQILGQLQENLKIAADDMIPICQDTGMAVIFLEIGQDVHLEGGLLEEAVNEGVRQGYTEGFLRKSVVKDPLIRENTKDNTPAVLHIKIVAGDKVKIKVAPKGFGSENMSRVFMLKPAEGIEGVKHAILTAVRDAGPNACPPMVVGVGIGGTFEKCALMAKEAFLEEHPNAAQIEVIDSNCYSMGYGYPLIQACRKAMQGESFEEILAYIRDYLERVRIYFSPFTLKYVKKSGRVSCTAAFVGEMIGLRPIISATGTTSVVDKVRGNAAILSGIAKLFEQKRGTGAVSVIDCPGNGNLPGTYQNV